MVELECGDDRRRHSAPGVLAAVHELPCAIVRGAGGGDVLIPAITRPDRRHPHVVIDGRDAGRTLSRLRHVAAEVDPQLLVFEPHLEVLRPERVVVILRVHVADVDAHRDPHLVPAEAPRQHLAHFDVVGAACPCAPLCRPLLEAGIGLLVLPRVVAFRLGLAVVAFRLLRVLGQLVHVLEVRDGGIDLVRSSPVQHRVGVDDLAIAHPVLEGVAVAFLHEHQPRVHDLLEPLDRVLAARLLIDAARVDDEMVLGQAGLHLRPRLAHQVALLRDVVQWFGQ